MRGNSTVRQFRGDAGEPRPASRLRRAISGKRLRPVRALILPTGANAKFHVGFIRTRFKGSTSAAGVLHTVDVGSLSGAAWTASNSFIRVWCPAGF